MSRFRLARPFAVALAMVALVVSAPAGAKQAAQPPRGNAWANCQLPPGIENLQGSPARKLPNGLFEYFLDDCTTVTSHGGDPAEAPDESPGLSTRTASTLQALGAPVCATTNKFVAIYLKPSNVTSRYTTMKSTIQNVIKQVDGKLLAEAQNRMGSAAQSHYEVACDTGGIRVDNVTSSQSTSTATFSNLISELQGKGYTADKYMILWDGAFNSGFSGQATVRDDSSDSASNTNNSGNSFAFAYNTTNWETWMHEMGHNLGAVQHDAPGSTGPTHWHCRGNKSDDVMCYNDGASNWTATPICGVNTVSGQNNYDICQNQYWAPGHRSDSTYIGTHWNQAECATGPSTKWLVATWCGWSPPGSDTTNPTTSITAPAAGATVSGAAVSITASASDNVGVTKVEFLVDGVLKLTDTTSPYAASWDTTSASNGSHALTSKAYDAAGNVGTSATVTVTVSNAASPTAAFDSGLQAPLCATVANVCDSGTSLLLGRGSVGPEPNAPNTIGDSCADGNDGTFHVDESLDRLKVATTDGTNLAAGKTVTITATVWAWTTPSDDSLHLYYAPDADAASPTWTFIATVQPTAGGAQALTTTYTLPSGGTRQAIRGVFRYQGGPSVCVGSATYTDHDDLAFAVGGGSSDTTAPTTSLTAPAAGATVSGAAVNVAASASDNVGVARVEFLVDGVLEATDTTSAYSFAWDTTAETNGSHTLQSRAFDAAGNSGVSSTITVTVDNAVGTFVCNDGVDNNGDGVADADDPDCWGTTDPNAGGSWSEAPTYRPEWTSESQHRSWFWNYQLAYPTCSGTSFKSYGTHSHEQECTPPAGYP